MNEEYLIQTEEVQRTHYTQIPNIIIDNRDLSHSAIRLYLYYKRICWDKGKCTQSLDSICLAAAMKRETAIAARNQLNEHGLIIVKRGQLRDKRRITITIVDIWEKNAECYRESCPDLGPKGRPRSAISVRKGDLDQQSRSERATLSIEGKKNTMSELNSSDSEHIPTNGNNVAKSNGSVRPKKKSKPPSSRFDMVAAHKIYVIANNGVAVNNWNNTKHRKWADSIRLMRTQDGISVNRIKDAVVWYADHAHGQYSLQIRCGETLRRKFERLELAMQKEKQNGHNPDEVDDKAEMDRFVEQDNYNRAIQTAEDRVRGIEEGLDNVFPTAADRDDALREFISEELQRAGIT